MNELWISLATFWGVWLLVPVLVDGASMLLGLVGMAIHRLSYRPPPPLAHSPAITVLIPVHNSATTLGDTLRSLEAQTYPLNALEVILINNRSSDDSFQIFHEYQQTSRLNLTWLSIYAQGKSWALNAGIHLAQGAYVFNIDSDVILFPETLQRAVERFEAMPELAAITGYIEIASPAPSVSAAHRLLVDCEFLEYLTSFGVGRSYQSLVRSIYTLSGAFSGFRRDALAATYLYNQDTVSEDTDLTFQLYERGRYRVASFPEVRLQVQPIESLAALYAQRVRWQRGQLEVSASHRRLLARQALSPLRFSPARTLLVDHTLSFPRLIWMFFLPVLLEFGYSPGLLATAYFLVYLLYLAIEVIWVAAAAAAARPNTRARVLGRLAVIPLMPVYRVLVFFFRFSGFLVTMAEPGVWRVPDPLEQARTGWKALMDDLRRWGQVGTDPADRRGESESFSRGKP